MGRAHKARRSLRELAQLEKHAIDEPGAEAGVSRLDGVLASSGPSMAILNA